MKSYMKVRAGEDWKIYSCGEDDDDGEDDDASEVIATLDTETLADALMEVLTRCNLHFPGTPFVPGDRYLVQAPTNYPERYRVIWEIDSDAETPEKAAQEAWDTMRAGDNIPVFEVIDQAGQRVIIACEDLTPE
jgi:hypothetical protein